MKLNVRGRVFSGMGKGKYYVGHPEYQKRFEAALGYAPYPGTLNLKLDEERALADLRRLREFSGVKVEGFKVGDESFSALNCFNGSMDGVPVTLLFIDVTYYNESVGELISPEYLRRKLGLVDGQACTFTLDVPEAFGKS